MLVGWLANLVAWREWPAVAMGGRAVRRPGFAAADMGRGWSLFNSATLLAPLSHDSDEVLAEVEEFYAAGAPTGGGVRLWSAWPTPGLQGRGWLLYDEPWLLTCDPGRAVAPPAVGVSVREVSDEESLRSFVDLVARAFPFADLAARRDAWDARVLDVSGVRLWLGLVDGEAVATSATVVAGGFNGVTLVATAPPWRGRGIGAYLAWWACRAAPALPAGLLAGARPRPVYERLGFEVSSRFTVWARERPGGG